MHLTLIVYSDTYFLNLQLIIAIAGVLTGYNGSFEFKEPGQKYEDTPYLGMRVVSSITTFLAKVHSNLPCCTGSNCYLHKHALLEYLRPWNLHAVLDVASATCTLYIHNMQCIYIHVYNMYNIDVIEFYVVLRMSILHLWNIQSTLN